MSATVQDASGVGGAVPARDSVEYPKSRLLYWSIRRELWENRSIIFAPTGVAALMLVGFLFGARRLVDVVRGVVLDADRQAELLTKPMHVMAIPIVVTAFIVAVFYCLDALHGERRDRSILFWKSLPVSDLMTVLSKALIPLVVLPAVALVVVMTLQLTVLLIASAVFRAADVDASVLWVGLPLLHTWVALIDGIVGYSLWYAPIYGWLLLVSGWARRSTFLWAALPPLALCLVEKIAFGTGFAWSLLKSRLFGFGSSGFDVEHHDGTTLDPLSLLGSPGLWIGLAVAAIFFAAAVWFRRFRQPI